MGTRCSDFRRSARRVRIITVWVYVVVAIVNVRPYGRVAGVPRNRTTSST